MVESGVLPALTHVMTSAGSAEDARLSALSTATFFSSHAEHVDQLVDLGVVTPILAVLTPDSGRRVLLTASTLVSEFATTSPVRAAEAFVAAGGVARLVAVLVTERADVPLEEVASSLSCLCPALDHCLSASSNQPSSEEVIGPLDMWMHALQHFSNARRGDTLAAQARLSMLSCPPPHNWAIAHPALSLLLHTGCHYECAAHRMPACGCVPSASHPPVAHHKRNFI